MGACGEAFGAGDFTAGGEGTGTSSGVACFVGDGSAVAFRDAFEFSFAEGLGLNSSLDDGDAETFAFKLVLTFVFAGTLIGPPAGIPSSALPVAGCATSTGLLFGSAFSAGSC